MKRPDVRGVQFIASVYVQEESRDLYLDNTVLVQLKIIENVRTRQGESLQFLVIRAVQQPDTCHAFRCFRRHFRIHWNDSHATM
jgi:hypothetical protein